MAKDTLIKKEKQRRSIQNEDHPFISRNIILNIILMWVLYPAASIYSALTEGGHIYIRFDKMFGGGSMGAIAGTLFLVLLIEVGKYFFGSGAIEDMRKGVFTEGGAFKSAFVIKFMGALLCFGFSIFLSIKGAPLLNEHFRDMYQPVQADLIDIAAINTDFDLRIADQDDVITKGASSTWKGVITRKGQNTINEAQKTKNLIEQQRTAALEEAKSTNKERMLQYKQETEMNGNWAMGFSGVGELLALLCLAFSGVYESGVEQELKKQPTPSAPSGQNSPDADIEELTLMLQEIGQRLSNMQSAANLSNTAQQVSKSPSSTPRKFPGFNVGLDGNVISVATRLQPVATPSTEISGGEVHLEKDRLLRALADAKKNYDAWAAKLRKGRGRSSTNQRHMDRLAREMKDIETEIKKIG